ncbi:hypothetical protein [Haliovirga abyssi]|uniref:Uncharacterized protein n=1 Tax=Haliovirga abyssi TaxID=2996794 RepID=A0AAU9DUR9_9FUSO|nr:hypothetical protein [Haliovirga abyssi]BDU49771.1 hypothetical protein HLVA_03400 [Haliovirga abyssi]
MLRKVFFIFIIFSNFTFSYELVLKNIDYLNYKSNKIKGYKIEINRKNDIYIKYLCGGYSNSAINDKLNLDIMHGKVYFFDMKRLDIDSKQITFLNEKFSFINQNLNIYGVNLKKYYISYKLRYMNDNLKVENNKGKLEFNKLNYINNNLKISILKFNYININSRLLINKIDIGNIKVKSYILSLEIKKANLFIGKFELDSNLKVDNNSLGVLGLGRTYNLIGKEEIYTLGFKIKKNLWDLKIDLLTGIFIKGKYNECNINSKIIKYIFPFDIKVENGIEKYYLDIDKKIYGIIRLNYEKHFKNNIILGVEKFMPYIGSINLKNVINKKEEEKNHKFKINKSEILDYLKAGNSIYIKINF